MIRITDFHRIKGAVPEIFWVIGLHHLRDALKSPVATKSTRGARIGCFGCQTYIEPGERYHLGTSADRKEKLGLHVDGCALHLLAKARELDALNGARLCDRLFGEWAIPETE